MYEQFKAAVFLYCLELAVLLILSCLISQVQARKPQEERQDFVFEAYAEITNEDSFYIDDNLDDNNRVSVSFH